MVKAIIYISISLFLFLNLPYSLYAAEKERKYIPTAVPIGIQPMSYGESRWGIGFNRITITSDWEDDFFTGETEDVGEITYTVSNLAVGLMKSRSNVSTVEYDLLVGIIESEAKTRKYYSGVISRDVQVNHAGDGFDIGVRIVMSKMFHKQEGRPHGRTSIDWIYALGLHGALFSTNGTFNAESIDGQFANTYDEEETGFFFRPVFSLQPIVRLTEKLSLIPYLGLGTKLTISEYYWEDKEYVFNGFSLPSQLEEGEGMYVNLPGLETYVGFDIAVFLGTRRAHSVTLGGAMSRLLGEKEASFSELHFLYSVPF